jgi:hypothetical protein
MGRESWPTWLYVMGYDNEPYRILVDDGKKHVVRWSEDDLNRLAAKFVEIKTKAASLFLHSIEVLRQAQHELKQLRPDFQERVISTWSSAPDLRRKIADVYKEMEKKINAPPPEAKLVIQQVETRLPATFEDLIDETKTDPSMVGAAWDAINRRRMYQMTKEAIDQAANLILSQRGIKGHEVHVTMPDDRSFFSRLPKTEKLKIRWAVAGVLQTQANELMELFEPRDIKLIILPIGDHYTSHDVQFTANHCWCTARVSSVAGVLRNRFGHENVTMCGSFQELKQKMFDSLSRQATHNLHFGRLNGVPKPVLGSSLST